MRLTRSGSQLIGWLFWGMYICRRSPSPRGLLSAACLAADSACEPRLLHRQSGKRLSVCASNSVSHHTVTVTVPTKKVSTRTGDAVINARLDVRAVIIGAPDELRGSAASHFCSSQTSALSLEASKVEHMHFKKKTALL